MEYTMYVCCRCRVNGQVSNEQDNLQTEYGNQYGQ